MVAASDELVHRSLANSSPKLHLTALLPLTAGSNVHTTTPVTICPIKLALFSSSGSDLREVNLITGSLLGARRPGPPPSLASSTVV